MVETKNNIFSDDGCEDHNWLCSVWAAEGECNNNPAYMLESCAKSCENCASGKDAQMFQEL